MEDQFDVDKPGYTYHSSKGNDTVKGCDFVTRSTGFEETVDRGCHSIRGCDVLEKGQMKI